MDERKSIYDISELNLTEHEESAPFKEPERQNYYIEQCRNYIELVKKLRGKDLTYSVVTFGCQMNAHDSEKLKGVLDKIGYTETESENADVVIYNTCTVRENANKKLYGHLGHLKKTKSENPDMIIGLCGCMMQEPSVVEKLKKSYRYVDIIFGTHNIFSFAELLYRKLTGEKMVIEVLKEAKCQVEALPQKRKYSFKSGVNIMYGCNNFCTYCIVPYVRGRERSRTPEEILGEIKALVSDGVIEVMLLGQNVNSYGVNFIGESTILSEKPDYDFPDLLSDVCKIEGLKRVRFMTSHPKDLSDKLIEVIKNEPKVCRHIHLPVQSGSSNILKVMNRRYDKERYLELVEKIKTNIPEASLSTDIMIGFPGETEEDFLETLDVVEKARYDQAFTFIYSKRTGTPASVMENQVPEDVVKDRFDRLLKRVNEIADERTKRLEGKTVRALVEDVNDHDSELVTARLDNNLLVHFKGDKSLIGSMVEVKLLEAKGFYYMGEME